MSRAQFRGFAQPLRLGLPATCVAALLCAGCITATSPQIASMKDDIESAVGGDFEREVGIRLGRISIGLGRAVLGMVAGAGDGDEDLAEVTGMLRGLRKVEISVYQTGSREAGGWRDAPARVERAMARGSWMPTVRVRSDDELAWVFCRLDEAEKLRGVTVVTLDDEQLTFVRLAGRLDRALAAAITLARQHGDRGDGLDVAEDEPGEATGVL